MRSFQIHLTLRHQQAGALARHKAEIWLEKPGADEQIGSGITDAAGECSIAFSLPESAFKKQPPFYYVLVYDRDKLVYGVKEKPQYQLLEADIKIRLTLNHALRVPLIDIVPLQKNMLQKLPGKLEGLTEKQKTFVNGRFNEALKAEVLRIVSQMDPRLSGAVAKLSFDYQKFQDKTIGELIREAVLPALQADPDARKLLEERNLLQGAADIRRTVKEALSLEQPLNRNPVFREDLRILETHELTAALKIDKDMAEILLERPTDWEEAGEQDWQDLVDAGLISASDKTTLQLGFAYARFSGGSGALAADLFKTLNAPGDMVKLELADWRSRVAAAGNETPNGETPEEYAGNLFKLAQRSFPSAFFLHRIAAVPKQERLSSLSETDALLQKNEKIIHRRQVAVSDWGEVPKPQREALETALDTQRRLSNTYHYLGVEDILNDRKRNGQAKARAIQEAIVLLETFYKNNPGLDFRATNFLEKPADTGGLLNWDDIPEAKRPLVRKQMLAHQRVQLLSGGDFDTSIKLLEAGFDAVQHVAQCRLSRLSELTGLSEEDAGKVKASADRMADQSAHAFMAAYDLHWGQSVRRPSDNALPFDPAEGRGFSVSAKETATSTKRSARTKRDGALPAVARSNYGGWNELMEIDGYTDIFGPLNYCACDHCRSIFSPAAYFVDLMRFVENNVHYVDPLDANQVRKGIAPGDPLSLKFRRPDLWKLRLTCENTDTLIPYLTIVNEVKEAYIKQESGNPNLDVWSILAKMQDNSHGGIKRGTDYSFHLPFNLAYEESRILLENAGMPLPVLLRQFNDSLTNEQALAWLGCSPQEWDAIKTVNTAAVPDRYGARFDNTNLRVPMSDFLRLTGLERSEVEAFLKLKVISNAGSSSIYKKTAVSDPYGIEPFEEFVVSTLEGFDRIHRFTRLWRLVPQWTMRELDLVLEKMDTAKLDGPTTGNYDLGTATVNIGQLRHIQDELNLSVEELIALFGPIPDVSLAETSVRNPLTGKTETNAVPGLFTRLFGDDWWPDPPTPNDDKAFDINEQADAVHIWQALGCTHSELKELFTHLSIPKNAGSLSRTELEEVFRNVRIAQGLGISVSDLIHVSKLFYHSFNNLEAILYTIETVQQIKAGRLSIDDLWFLLNKTPRTRAYRQNPLAIVARLQEDPALYFDNVTFAVAGGLSQADADLVLTYLTDKKALLINNGKGGYRVSNLIFAGIAWAGIFDDITDKDVKKRVKSRIPDIQYFLLDRHPEQMFNPTAWYFDQAEFSTATSLGGAQIEEVLEYLCSTKSHIPILIFNPQKGYRPSNRLYAPINWAKELDSFNLGSTMNGKIRDFILSKSPEEAAAPLDLDKHQPLSRDLPNIVMETFSIDAARLEAIETWVGQALVDKNRIPMLNAAILKTVNGAGTVQYQITDNSLTIDTNNGSNWDTFIHKTEQLVFLADKLALENGDIYFIKNHKSLFQIGPEVEDLLRLNQLADLYERNPATPHAYIHDILSALGSKLFTPNLYAQIAAWLDCSPDLPAILHGSKAIWGNGTSDAVFALTKLAGIVDSARGLRVGGKEFESLSNLQKADYGKAEAARDALVNGFRAGYRDITHYEKAWEPLADRFNALRRDALCDYLLYRPAVNGLPDFNDPGDLYDYLLMDVETSSCMRTSRLVEAIKSVQLYIDRTQNNLEQSNEDDHGNQRSFRAVLGASVEEQESLTKEWWDWRKNYRVWEANRKVFLWPENWIVEDLRDDQSPIFKELAEELLQEKISMEAAEGAYKEYLKKFIGVSNLRIAGICYDENKREYHIFGRTEVDPYQYFYRKYLTAYNEWTPWEKIELSISAPHVGPVIHRKKPYIFWVDVIAEEKTSFIDGNSSFEGFKQTVTLNYSYLDERGKWLQPQKISIATDPLNKYWTFIDFYIFGIGKNDQGNNFKKEFYEKTKAYRKIYPIVRGNNVYICYFRECIHEPEHDNWFRWSIFYRLDEFSNQLVEERYPFAPNKAGALALVETNGGAEFRLGHLKHNAIETDDHEFDRLSDVQVYNNKLLKQVSHYSDKRHVILNKVYISRDEDFDLVFGNNIGAYSNQNFKKELSPRLHFVHSSKSFSQNIADYILEYDSQSYFIHRSWDAINNVTIRKVTRLSTTVNKDFILKINEGIDGFLSLDTQYKHESVFNLSFPNNDLIWSTEPQDQLNFKGALGGYFKEMFFHIPITIAHHLNAEGKFKEAHHWFNYIFDPTAAPESNLNHPSDHYWRYLDFRDQTLQSLVEMLTDPVAIRKYREDPFNPHAIARLRPGAYQKYTVFSYVDNLLDWADKLFSEFTMESMGEAQMLYMLAQNILGERPMQAGKCQTAPDSEMTYENISAALGNKDYPFDSSQSDFLLLLPNWLPAGYTVIQQSSGGSGQGKMAARRDGFTPSAMPASLQSYNSLAHEVSPVIPGLQPYQTGLTHAGQQMVHTMSTMVIAGWKPAFCIPFNEKMLEYWDRVADRLFKLRNCMDINGVKRSPALFEPPIDPALLVAARAAGLSMDDILGSLYAELPAYRFVYLVEKAKAFSGTVQGFGGALLSALEKKDVEALALLQNTQSLNMLKMTKEIKKKAIEEAKANLQSTMEGMVNVMNRVVQYTEWIEENLNGWERTQQISLHTASIIKGTQGVMHTLSAIFGLLPNIGSPFAITYGGKELSTNMAQVANTIDVLGQMAGILATSAGLEASFQRRRQEWEFQKKTAEQEIKQVQYQIASATIRLAMAEKDLKIHEKQVEQAEELFQFYKDKVTNLGLYNFLAATLRHIHREAYNVAMDMARQAEQAYKFETGDDTFTGISGGIFWDSSRAGLLAGEQLTLQLQKLEAEYMANHRRQMEIRQSFSMLQINPEAMVELRANGACTFKIPEWAFDLHYPGHHRRRMVSVQITLPCVTGPYTSVAATLAYNSGSLKKEAGGATTGFNFRGCNMIATSSASNDGGQFELNFRDERYLPFEGAGAVDSEWRLELPQQFRTFDYKTISDVIFHISYRSKYDGGQVAAVNAALRTAMNTYGLKRLISLKQEFPDVWHQLKSANAATLEIKANLFPYFAQGGTLGTVMFLKEIDINGKLDWGTIVVTPSNPPSNLEGALALIKDTDPLKTHVFMDDVTLLLSYTV